MNRIYMCIDLKSFFASVECVLRGLDPLNTNLVVADKSRTEKTVCLAVTPSLKQYGIGGRARLYEVISEVKRINYNRFKDNKYKPFTNKSYIDSELKNNKNLELDFIVASPQMSMYMKYSNTIYNIYLRYLSSDDIFPYSIDEVFCDITDYLNTYNLNAREFTTKIIHDVYKETGITATAGIGTNLYLAKIAMDIVAKHVSADEYGVRIASLDEMSYRKLLWNFKPITKFWRIGKGIGQKLERYNMFTMGDVARVSLTNEELLYKLFGVNAELIIDHAWGYEPCTIKDVKSYKPQNTSISSAQVLHEPYDYIKTRLIIKEMVDLLSLELVSKKLKTKSISITIGYDVSNLENPFISEDYNGEIVTDYYGRNVPKSAHGSINLDYYTSSSKILIDKSIKLYDSIINKKLLIRRVNISLYNLISEEDAKKEKIIKQLDLFSIVDDSNTRDDEERDVKLQRAVISIKNKYGKNSILKAMNLEEGATTRERNKQIGGHSE